MDPSLTNTAAASPSRPGGLKLFAIIFGAVLLAMLLAALVIRLWLFPPAFTPVQLDTSEKLVLNQKLRTIGYSGDALPVTVETSAPLEPQPYSEAGASREVRLSERELNALVARNTDLARKLAIDLSENLASARLVLPLDPDFPILGGQTLRMSAGLEVALRDGRPVMILKGVSAWGVPLPNAWLGNLKNVDLVGHFGEQPGFWRAFSQGIEYVAVRDGELLIRLRP